MRTNLPHDVDVPPLGIPADVISLTNAAPFQHHHQRASMILDIKPISHVLAFSVHRERLAFEGPYDGERNQLFRKLIRSIIVRTIGDYDRELIGMKPSAHQMVGCGL